LGLIILLGLAWPPPPASAAPPAPVQAPIQSFDTASATPRPVEEATALAIQRDYTQAWQSLVSALEENRAEMLDENFTGGARQQWQDAIHAQQQNGLSRRIVDHGHRLRGRFYSLDGSALEAVDTADLEIQYREGSKLLFSERIQAHYLVLLTPAENSWKVRILQEFPRS
jgi:hypothetical protein